MIAMIIDHVLHKARANKMKTNKPGILFTTFVFQKGDLSPTNKVEDLSTASTLK